MSCNYHYAKANNKYTKDYDKNKESSYIKPNLGGLFRDLFWGWGKWGEGGEGAGNITLLSKIVRILLETWKIFLLEPRLS